MKINLIPIDDFTFKASFMFDGHNLETEVMDRTVSADEVKTAVKTALEMWQSKRADDNFDKLVKTFEKDVTLG